MCFLIAFAFSKRISQHSNILFVLNLFVFECFLNLYSLLVIKSEWLGNNWTLECILSLWSRSLDGFSKIWLQSWHLNLWDQKSRNLCWHVRSSKHKYAYMITLRLWYDRLSYASAKYSYRNKGYHSIQKSFFSASPLFFIHLMLSLSNVQRMARGV